MSWEKPLNYTLDNNYVTPFANYAMDRDQGRYKPIRTTIQLHATLQRPDKNSYVYSMQKIDSISQTDTSTTDEPAFLSTKFTPTCSVTTISDFESSDEEWNTRPMPLDCLTNDLPTGCDTDVDDIKWRDSKVINKKSNSLTEYSPRAPFAYETPNNPNISKPNNHIAATDREVDAKPLSSEDEWKSRPMPMACLTNNLHTSCDTDVDDIKWRDSKITNKKDNSLTEYSPRATYAYETPNHVSKLNDHTAATENPSRELDGRPLCSEDRWKSRPIPLDNLTNNLRTGCDTDVDDIKWRDSKVTNKKSNSLTEYSPRAPFAYETPNNISKPNNYTAATDNSFREVDAKPLCSEDEWKSRPTPSECFTNDLHTGCDTDVDDIKWRDLKVINTKIHSLTEYSPCATFSYETPNNISKPNDHTAATENPSREVDARPLCSEDGGKSRPMPLDYFTNNLRTGCDTDVDDIKWRDSKVINTKNNSLTESCPRATYTYETPNRISEQKNHTPATENHLIEVDARPLCSKDEWKSRSMPLDCLTNNIHIGCDPNVDDIKRYDSKVINKKNYSLTEYSPRTSYADETPRNISKPSDHTSATENPFTDVNARPLCSEESTQSVNERKNSTLEDMRKKEYRNPDTKPSDETVLYKNRPINMNVPLTTVDIDFIFSNLKKRLSPKNKRKCIDKSKSETSLCISQSLRELDESLSDIDLRKGNVAKQDSVLLYDKFSEQPNAYYIKDPDAVELHYTAEIYISYTTDDTELSTLKNYMIEHCFKCFCPKKNELLVSLARRIQNLFVYIIG